MSDPVALPVVNSFNEWDPLEEVIVGRLDGAAQPAFEIPFYAYIPIEYRDALREVMLGMAGTHLEIPEAARRELEEFAHVLEAEGVTVRRPEPIDHTRPFATPDWSVPCGSGQTCPRDVMIVVGNEIIESPMSYRSRFFDYRPYRPLVRKYFAKGARWTAAPKPLMTRELYRNLYREPPVVGKFATTEFEPVFDAADIARCGKDLFVQRSHVTNESGIEWLRRHLAPSFNVHQVDFDDYRAVHIDATWVPVAPGKVIVNPDRPIKALPDCFRKGGWDFLAPPISTWKRSESSTWPVQWLILNVLMLDEQRMIVEKSQETFIRTVRDWGFKPIPVAFTHAWRFGGSFHCFTCDIRRRGHLQSYF